MENTAHKKILAACVAIGLIGAFALYRVEVKLEGIERLSPTLSSQASNSMQAIEGAKNEAIQTLHTTATKDLVASAKAISDQQVKALQDRLQILAAKIAEHENAKKLAEEKLNRALNGLPEQIDLDKLNNHYAEIWSKQSNDYGAVESFNTAQGSISFQKRHFSFAYIPSSEKIAWLKIGKDNSQENSELIKAWLDEAERAKVQLGYAREYRKTKPSDYGEYTESLYRKGDAYFKTFLQFQRVQGTYGRHSLQYSYYVEIGSEARRQKYELEQYNQKLGS